MDGQLTRRNHTLDFIIWFFSFWNKNKETQNKPFSVDFKRQDLNNIWLPNFNENKITVFEQLSFLYKIDYSGRKLIKESKYLHSSLTIFLPIENMTHNLKIVNLLMSINRIKNNASLTTLISWTNASPNLTSTFWVMFCTGRMSLLYPLNRSRTSLSSSSEQLTGKSHE